MCDDRIGDDMKDFLRKKGLTRRDFGALSAAAAIAITLPRAAHAVDVMEMDVSIQTPDGTADCYFVHPVTGAAPGVLIWPDALGLRPAFRQMGRRLAEEGYSVLVVNPFYRLARSPVVPAGSTFADEATRNVVMPLMRSLSPEINVADASAFVGWLDAQSVVDKSRKIGTMGYCMGGPITMRTAAAIPGRVGAGASFHGGGLVTDAPDSPHLLVSRMQAQYLFAIAANDDMQDPNAKNVLRDTFAAAGLPAEIEVYTDTLHGWCPPDSAVYDEAQAERAWGRLLALFGTALA